MPGASKPDPELGERLKNAELAFIMTPVVAGPGTHGPAGRAGPEPVETKPWGIALSGGGIRSATFSLGVLQALAENDLLRCFHYQSTISGGGYAGAFLQGLLHRGGFDRAMAILASHVGEKAATPEAARPEDARVGPAEPCLPGAGGCPPDGERSGAPPDGGYFEENRQRPIRHLREYSNYLSPRKDLLSGDTLGMLATYLRNVVLIQVQLFALAVALSLAPLLLYRLLGLLGRDYGLACLIGAAGCAVAAGCLLKQISAHAGSPPRPVRGEARAASNPMGGSQEEQPTAKALRQALVIIYVIAAGAVLAALGLWGAGPASAGRFRPGLILTTSICYLAVWMLWIVELTRQGRRAGVGRRGQGSADPDPLARFLAATLAAAVLAGAMLAGLQRLVSGWLPYNFWHVITFGPAGVLAVVMLTGVVHVGLAGPALTDLQREMWARVAGKAAAAVLALAAALTMMIYVPGWMADLLGRIGHVTGWLSMAAWLALTGAGVFAGYSQRSCDTRVPSLIFKSLARAAPVVFLAGLLIAVSWATRSVLHRVVHTGCGAGGHVASCVGIQGSTLLAEHGLGWIFLALSLVLGLWFLFGISVDQNEFSMNALYRNRLVRCYLGASNAARQPEPTTNFDPGDDIVLADLAAKGRDQEGRRPLFPLIGATLNLVDAKQLDWQDRKAASFCFTPLCSGYVPPPSHPDATAITDAGSREGLPIGGMASGAPGGVTVRDGLHQPGLAQTMMLGSAVAISGAAVSPNMGYHSSPSVTLLLTLFDARLGWWLPNPRFEHRSSGDAPQITFYGKWLVREMLGRTREEDAYVYLSDGGHFENLGIYELVRRRCEFILCVDSTADPEGHFADLGNAIHKCRTDFGCDIDIDVSALRNGPNGRAQRHCALGTIDYGHGRDGRRELGILLYIKPSLAGDETADVAYYARVHPTFPHESTADQYFDEAQFESYRRLGRGIAASVFEKVIERAKAESSAANVSCVFGLGPSDLKASFLRELQYQWIAPLQGLDRHFSKHSRAMALLFAKLRKEPALSALDAHLYPAWEDISRAPPKRDPRQLVALPRNDEFRACFYFCQELLQLMESVYHDLDLERAWNHPDNRGWMNAFRQWSWSPVFRVAWAVGSPTYGKPFVTFCELRLGLPALEMQAFTTVEASHLQPGSSWQHACNALLAERRINRLEYGVLTAAPLAEAVAHAQSRRHIFLLRLNWGEVMARSHCALTASTVGVAVLVDGTLRILRIQDHMRKMGLATVFIRHIVRSRVPFRGVEIRSGRYGDVGEYSREHAALYTQRLDAMRNHAQSSEAH